MLGMIQDFLTVAVRTRLLDDGSASTAFVTGDLCLREHAGEDLLTNNLDTVASASCAGVYVGGRGCPRSSAVVAKNLLLDHELERELSKRRGFAQWVMNVHRCYLLCTCPLG